MIPGLTFGFMDSGQGDCTLVIYPDGSMAVVDCGAMKNKDVAVKAIKGALERYLPQDKKVTNLVLTHADQDHYNMVDDLFGSNGVATVEQVYYGAELDLYKNQKENDATYKWLKKHKKASVPPNSFGGAKKDPHLSRPDVDVYILSCNSTGKPDREDSHGSNSNSIALLFVYKEIKVFLMGDATYDTEAFIMKWCTQGNLDTLLTDSKETVLKMGHHGSDSSSSEAWIKKIRPHKIFISSDTRSFGRYGTGIPRITHLEEVITNSGRIVDLPQDFKHPMVVYWDKDKGTDPYYGKFKVTPTTAKAVCTTLYKLDYNQTLTEFVATGGSWYYNITPDGEPLIAWTG